jgi:predicted ABC-type ATPase
VIENALDKRPVTVAIAGPNGAGKTTFFHSHLSEAGLRFVNADDIARELGISATRRPKLAAHCDVNRLDSARASSLRPCFLIRWRETGVPCGCSRRRLQCGAVLFRIADPETSEARVAMRVSQGGHDVPSEKLASRFRRTIKNLKAAIQTSRSS